MKNENESKTYSRSTGNAKPVDATSAQSRDGSLHRRETSTGSKFFFR